MDLLTIINKMHYEKSYLIYGDIKFPIYAHPNELLNNHSNKTLTVFLTLINNKLLSNFYHFFYKNNFLNITYVEFKRVIEHFVLFHDFGKISFSFQINRLNKDKNGLNSEGIFQKNLFLEIFGNLSYLENFEINHSFTSAYSYLNYLNNILNIDISDNLVLILLSLIINGHHSNIKDCNYFSDEINYTTSFLNILLENNYYNSLREFNKYNNNKDKIFRKVFKTFMNQLEEIEIDIFSSFYQYLYSLLITSDVIASSQYELDEITISKNNNRINNDLLVKMHNKFSEFNKKLDDNQPINKLRHEMFLESSENLLKALNDNDNNRMFYLNMPTGGGKTNTSMKLALDILENTNADRIFYAMPFITILDQNYDVICENFNLKDNTDIRKLCSTNSFLFKENDFIKDDDRMEYLSEILMNDDFLDYPVVCTTFVRLFNTIIRNNKRNKYGFASLSNSVVILDEVQSLPIKNWSSLYYILNDISEKLNIYFIFMSATLPEFKKLDDKYVDYKFIPLIENPQKYYDSPEFNDRTKIMSLPESYNINDLETLKEYLHSIISNNFDDNYFKGLIVLNTVKSSKLVYEIIKEFQHELDFDTDLLNSTIMGYKKKELIDKIANIENKRYILVSTQSIEAGVDVSFNFVIRDFTTLDSIEQIRGRCNRHNELPLNQSGKIYLINLYDDNKELFSYIYNKEELNTRINETKKLIIDDENIDYSFNDLKEYYENISKIKYEITISKEKKLESNDNDNIYSWNRMLYSNFDKKEGIHIIEDSNQVTLFLMIDMDISHFEDEEINYLKDIQKDLDYNLIEKNEVIAENILKYYDFDQLKDVTNYTERKIIKKEFSSIIDKFLINTYVNDELRQEYQINESYKKFNEKYFFFEVIPYELIGEGNTYLYSVKTGLNHDYKYFNDFRSKCC